MKSNITVNIYYKFKRDTRFHLYRTVVIYSHSKDGFFTVDANELSMPLQYCSKKFKKIVWGKPSCYCFLYNRYKSSFYGKPCSTTKNIV